MWGLIWSTLWDFLWWNAYIINYSYHTIVISLTIVLVYGLSWDWTIDHDKSFQPNEKSVVLISIQLHVCYIINNIWYESSSLVMFWKCWSLGIKKQVGICSFFYSLIEYHLLHHSCICLVLIFLVVASMAHCCISFTPVLRKGFVVGGLLGSLAVSLPCPNLII